VFAPRLTANKHDWLEEEGIATKKDLLEVN
jgi:hypothetical protein